MTENRVLETNVRFLEGALVSCILIKLYQHEGELTKTVLTSLVATGRSNLGEKYDDLENMGIIAVKKSIRKSAGHWVSLTAKGKQIAEKLIEIQDILTAE